MSAFSRTFSIAAKSDCFKTNELCSPILRGARLSVYAALHRPALKWQLPPSEIAEYVGRGRQICDFSSVAIANSVAVSGRAETWGALAIAKEKAPTLKSAGAGVIIN